MDVTFVSYWKAAGMLGMTNLFLHRWSNFLNVLGIPKMVSRASKGFLLSSMARSSYQLLLSTSSIGDDVLSSNLSNRSYIVDAGLASLPPNIFRKTASKWIYRVKSLGSNWENNHMASLSFVHSRCPKVCLTFNPVSLQTHRVRHWGNWAFPTWAEHRIGVDRTYDL